MRVYGRARVQDFLGRSIVYRNLIPIDSRLPGLPELREPLGLRTKWTPRKSSPEYARVVANIIERAQSLRGEKAPIERLVYIGDTRVNDGTAFANLLTAGGWDGVAFIGSQTPEPEETHVERSDKGAILLCNRWSGLDGLEEFCRARGVLIDERTVVVIDIDKTAIGARGRNDHVIDKVRLQAMQRTIRDIIGESFDERSFQADYSMLNQPLYHPFTTDNQDYLAYICLILQSGVITQAEFFHSLDGGELKQFAQFLALVDDCKIKLPMSSQRVHNSVQTAFLQGNPTLFVDFRRNEYKVTVEKMGFLSDQASVKRMLLEEIVITREVMEVALRFRRKGTLLFGLSDKPDEASLPADDLDVHRPLHEMETHVIGG